MHWEIAKQKFWPIFDVLDLGTPDSPNDEIARQNLHAQGITTYIMGKPTYIFRVNTPEVIYIVHWIKIRWELRIVYYYMTPVINTSLS